MPLNNNARKSPIAIVTHEFFPKKGGIAVFTQEMANALHNLGHSVDVFAPAHPTLASAKFPYMVKPIRCKGTQDWPCRLILATQLLRNREHLRNCIMYLPEPGPVRLLIYLQLIHLIKPKKLILTLHGSDINNLSMFPHRNYLFSRLLDKCCRVTVPSNFTGDLLTDKFPSAKSKLRLTPGALRSNFKVPSKSTKERNGRFTIITVARIHPRKGQHLMLEAINALQPEIKNRIDYRMIGPIIHQKYFNKLNTYIRNTGINAELVGEVADEKLSKIYQQADLFAMTSQVHNRSIEGFGLSYLEASANGIPILAHRTGGVEDAVGDGVSGILADPNDLSGLVTALKQLILDPNLRNTLGDGGRRWAQKFSWEQNAQITFS